MSKKRSVKAKDNEVDGPSTSKDISNRSMGKALEKSINDINQLLKSLRTSLEHVGGSNNFKACCNIKSNKAESVQDLIKLIFDSETMKGEVNTIGRYMSDMKLKEENQYNLDCLLGISNSLKEIQWASLIILKLRDKNDVNVNPVDELYEELGATIEPITMDRRRPEIKLLIATVFKSGPAKEYNLKLVKVFKVNRPDEADRYQPFQNWSNRRLLWHGSPLANYPGILRHGLMIAPPEVPATGYRFGKGIYFADLVDKAVKYCRMDRKKSTVLLLLCEVALWDMLERRKYDYIKKLPKHKHSTFGMGNVIPRNWICKDGVEYPKDDPFKDKEWETELKYNEYVVYDIAQVKIRYLVQMELNYK